MALHFEVGEFREREARARAALKREGLDAILLFAQESHYYLTGFDTSGFVFFQCAVLTADDWVPAYAQLEVTPPYELAQIFRS